MLVRLNEKHPFTIFSKACSQSCFLWNLKGQEREIMGHKSWVFEEKYLLEQADCSMGLQREVPFRASRLFFGSLKRSTFYSKPIVLGSLKRSTF